MAFSSLPFLLLKNTGSEESRASGEDMPFLASALGAVRIASGLEEAGSALAPAVETTTNVYNLATREALTGAELNSLIAGTRAASGVSETLGVLGKTVGRLGIWSLTLYKK